MRGRYGTTAFAVAGSLLLAACGSGGSAAPGAEPGFPVTVESCGRAVTIEQPPRRVATIGEDAAILMWGAGAADTVVGKALDRHAPLGAAAPALQDVPTFAPTGSPARELIIAQEPDLVISWGLFETTPEALGQAGIDSYELSGYCEENGNPDKRQDNEDVYHDLELFGRLFGTQDEVASRISELRQRVDAVRNRIEPAPEGTVGVLYVDNTSLLAYNRSTMAQTQLDTLGLTNVFADVTGDAHAEISLEEIIARDPDQLVLLTYQQTAEQARQALLAQPGIGQLRAVRENRVHVHPLAYSKPNLLAFDGLEQMAGQLLRPVTR